MSGTLDGIYSKLCILEEEILSLRREFESAYFPERDEGGISKDVSPAKNPRAGFPERQASRGGMKQPYPGYVPNPSCMMDQILEFGPPEGWEPE